MTIIFLFFITTYFTIMPMAAPPHATEQNTPAEQGEFNDQEDQNENNIIYGPITLEEFLQLQAQNQPLEAIFALQQQILHNLNQQENDAL